jgi:hypothetical protein
MHLSDEFGRRRHVAIFHRRPENAGRLRRALDNPARIVDFGCERLFAQDVEPCVKQRNQYVAVGVVGAGDNYRIAQARRCELSRTGKGLHAVRIQSPKAFLAQPSELSVGSANAVTTAPGVIARLWMCSTPIMPEPTRP